MRPQPGAAAPGLPRATRPVGGPGDSELKRLGHSDGAGDSPADSTFSWLPAGGPPAAPDSHPSRSLHSAPAARGHLDSDSESESAQAQCVTVAVTVLPV